jgi:hypothetical protein
LSADSVRNLLNITSKFRIVFFCNC